MIHAIRRLVAWNAQGASFMIHLITVSLLDTTQMLHLNKKAAWYEIKRNKWLFAPCMLDAKSGRYSIQCYWGCFDISLSSYILYCKIYLTTPAKTLHKTILLQKIFFIIIWFQKIIDIQSRFQNLFKLNMIMQITNDKYHK